MFMFLTSFFFHQALKFDAPSDRHYFIDKLEAFLRSCEVPRERVELPEKTIKTSTVTKRDRQERLEKFFKVIFAQVRQRAAQV